MDSGLPGEEGSSHDRKISGESPQGGQVKRYCCVFEALLQRSRYGFRDCLDSPNRSGCTRRCPLGIAWYRKFLLAFILEIGQQNIDNSCESPSTFQKETPASPPPIALTVGHYPLTINHSIPFSNSPFSKMYSFFPANSPNPISLLSFRMGKFSW